MRSRAWAVGLLLVALGCGGGGTDPQSAPVASVVVEGPGSTLPLQGTLQLAASLRDAGGRVLRDRAVQWQSLQPAIAGVSVAGLVTGVSPGSATIVATSEGVSGQLVVQVLDAPNLTIQRVVLTQGTQRADGSIALVAGGLPALLQVIGRTQPAFPGAGPAIRVRVFDGNTPVFEDTRPMNGAGGTVADESAPLHTVLIPAAHLVPGLRVEVAGNPDGAFGETALDDNRWPAGGGTQPIAVRTLPPLQVHFVPIMLTIGGSVGPVNAGLLDEYLLVVRQMFPVAQVTPTIGGVFSTDVDFGGGQPAAWVAILVQLDALRVLEGTSRYYVGAIRPPPGVTFVQNGGWGYIPVSPQSTGPGTRTSLVVGVGWFNRAASTRELVAHELGHNHGRRHAPCGNPAGPDPLYPHAGGGIGVWGHDVYSFVAGLRPTIDRLAPGAGFDLMSYCVPVWTSDYTYAALLEWRSAGVVAAPEPCDCLLVWGSTSPEGVALSPAFRTSAHVARPAGTGTHRIEVLDAAGGVLYASRFTPAEVDHAPEHRSFVVAVPAGEAGGASIAAVRVVDEVGRAARSPAADPAGALVTARRVAADGVELTWDASRVPGLLARDPGTGRILGFGQSGRLRVTTGGAQVEVTAPLGVMTPRAVVTPVP